MHDLVLANYGDPLAADARTDADGRLYMLFTRAVDRSFRGALAFVFAGDLYPRGQCAASNQAEVFYARVPTSALRGYQGDTRDNWLRTMRPTVVHEVKHLASYAERTKRDAAVLEETWLEESTARLAEELWARDLFGYRQRGNTGYRASIHCEVRPTFAECAGRPAVMYDHFGGLAAYHRAAGGRSPLGRSEDGDNTFYGSGWSLVRWAIDQSGESESAFLRALTQESRLSGVDNLEARTGRSFGALLADWSLAGALDDLPGFTPARAQLTFPSWNVRDVYAGLNRDFAGSYPAPFPVTPRAVSYGAFTTDAAEVRGGAATLFELSGTPAGEQVIELRGGNGTPLPPSLRLAIVRVE
jgi:hypothetical protein